MLKRLKRFLAAMFAPVPYRKLTAEQARSLYVKAERQPMATRNNPARRVNSGLGVRSAAAEPGPTEDDFPDSQTLKDAGKHTGPADWALYSGHDSHDSGNSDHSSSSNHSSSGE